ERTGFRAAVRDVKISGAAATIQLPIVLARPDDTPSTTTTTDRSSGVAASAPPPLSAPTSVNAGANAAAGGGRGGAASTGRITMDSAGGVSQRSLNESIIGDWPVYPPPTGESYAPISPNRFQSTRDRPLSTFGADVDTASYTNVRRFLSSGQLPPADAVRIEELVNYFRFGYAEPRDGRPMALTTELGDCPWVPSHKLVLIGARARPSSQRE